MVAGYAISRTYLETLVDLPWNKFAARPPTAAPGGQIQAEQHEAQQSGDDNSPESKARESSRSSDAVDDVASTAQEFKGGPNCPRQHSFVIADVSGACCCNEAHVPLESQRTPRPPAHLQS